MYKLCKTAQFVARQRELEKRLMTLMTACRYEQITVSDFCAYVGIPRKAFYRYFSSKDGALYALLDHVLLEYESVYSLGMSGAQTTAIRELELFFRFWMDQKPLLDALAYSGLSGILLDRAMIFAARHPLLEHMLLKEDRKTREHIIQFLVCGLMVMVVNWHRDGFRYSVQEMAQSAARIVTKPLFSANRSME